MSDLTRHEQFLNHIAHPEDVVPDPQTREEYLLLEIAENKGGGDSLPEVTSDDNGDVLTVVEGAWAKAAPSGGATVITIDAQTHLLSKTWQEIHDLLVLGKSLLVVREFSGGTDASQTPILAVANTQYGYSVFTNPDISEVEYIMAVAASPSDYPSTEP